MGNVNRLRQGEELRKKATENSVIVEFAQFKEMYLEAKVTNVGTNEMVLDK